MSDITDLKKAVREAARMQSEKVEDLSKVAQTLKEGLTEASDIYPDSGYGRSCANLAAQLNLFQSMIKAERDQQAQMAEQAKTQ